MKKIRLLLAVSVLSGLFCMNAYASEQDEKNIQDIAVEANEKLMSSFDFEETYIYRDDYAGDYIDGDKLIVCLTEDADTQWYVDALTEYENNVEYIYVEHSYNELFSDGEKFAEALPENTCSSIGVRPTINAAHVTVSEANKTILKEYISDEPVIYYDYVLDDAEEEAWVYGDIVVTFLQTAPEAQSTLNAGKKISTIEYPGSSQWSSLGGSGRYNSANSFLIAGHAINATYPALYYSGNIIGSLTYRRYANNAYGDFAFTSMVSGYVPTANFEPSNSDFIGTTSNQAVNTVLSMYGANGVAVTCRVTEVGSTVTYDGISVKGLNTTVMLTGSAQAGDSGAPYRYSDKFCGIHDAYAASMVNTYLYYTPYVYINNAGFTLKTRYTL